MDMKLHLPGSNWKGALLPSVIWCSPLLQEAGRAAALYVGGVSLTSAGETRARYVEALRAADNHDVEPLLLFARS